MSTFARVKIYAGGMAVDEFDIQGVVPTTEQGITEFVVPCDEEDKVRLVSTNADFIVVSKPIPVKAHPKVEDALPVY